MKEYRPGYILGDFPMTFTLANNIYGITTTNGAGNYTIPTLPTTAAPGHMHTTGAGYVSLTGNIQFDNLEIDASTKMIFSLNGRRVPGTEKFKKYRDLFLSDYKLESSNNFHFHILVWEKNFGELAENPKEDYGCVLKPGDGVYFAFGNIESRNEFERWMSNYAFTFFQNENLEQPKFPLPRQGTLTGCYVPDPPIQSVVDPIMICNVKK